VNDDLNFELRASWREFEVPDSEQASLSFETHRRHQAATNQSLIDQAKGIVMSAYGSDSDTAGQLMTRLARASRVRVADLARAIIENATGAAENTNQRAAEVANRLMSGAVCGSDDSRQPPTRRTIDLRHTSPTTPPLSGAG
jgi:hypothetical protein